MLSDNRFTCIGQQLDWLEVLYFQPDSAGIEELTIGKGSTDSD
jgi:hypothetical protein